MALTRLQRELSAFVTDAVNLEDINITLPEVQKIIEGNAVDEHTPSDQQIVLNQHRAWKQLIAWVQNDSFAVTLEKACELHGIAAQEEALQWGQLRSGSVTIAGTDYRPPQASKLCGLFDEMLSDMEKLNDIYDKAIHVFLRMARCQFFYDVNKRMGRFMMNGVLLRAGFPAINLPAKEKLKFNQLMLSFYRSNDQKPMNSFLRGFLVGCLDS